MKILQIMTASFVSIMVCPYVVMQPATFPSRGITSPSVDPRLSFPIRHHTIRYSSNGRKNSRLYAHSHNNAFFDSHMGYSFVSSTVPTTPPAPPNKPPEIWKKYVEPDDNSFFRGGGGIYCSKFDRTTSQYTYSADDVKSMLPGITENTPWEHWGNDQYVFLGLHGTLEVNAKAIAKTGYDILKTITNSHGVGIYMTYSRKTARVYGNGYDTIIYLVEDGDVDEGRVCYNFARATVASHMLNCIRDDRVTSKRSPQRITKPPSEPSIRYMGNGLKYLSLSGPLLPHVFVACVQTSDNLPMPFVMEKPEFDKNNKMVLVPLGDEETQ